MANAIRNWDLKLASGKIARWQGTSGEDAARRYVATFPNETVIATRAPKFELIFGVPGIEE